MSLQRAIEHYHSLLDDDIAGESQRQLEDQLRQRGLFFGDRPLCSVLRPRFLTAAQYRFLRDRVNALMPAFEKSYRRAIADPTFRKQFGLFDWEESLIGDDPGFKDPSPVSRLDAFFVHESGGLKFTEYNGETPAAAAYNDILADMFLGLPIMRRFLHDYEVRVQPERHNVMHALIDAYHEWAGNRSKPVVAILDWKEVPTYSEFVITADYLNAQGIECVISDPREVEYTNGRLIACGRPIDLIYKRVLITELVERGGIDHPIIRAVRDHKVCMVNPFRCKILHKKASLAVLSDERNAGMFDATELEAIEMHIPWSRVVENRSTVAGNGEKIDLLDYVRHNKGHLVLKPNDEYGGTGIVLGWTVSDDEWSDAVNTAILEPTIVQERIELPEEPYPSMVNGKVEFTDRVLDTAPFIFNGTYMDGCLTRLSTEALVNVTAGGGSSLATFVCEPRVGGTG
jgi:hypothetical protein